MNTKIQDTLNRSVCCLVFFVLAGFASAATYTSEYGNGTGSPNNITVPIGTHTFEVNNIASNRMTEWYVNGIYTGSSENDSSGFFAINPQYTCYISTVTQIKAVIFDQSFAYDQTHIWNCSIGLPDLRVEDISLSPTQVDTGTNTFHITVRLRNIGQSTSETCRMRIQTSGPLWYGESKTVQIPSLSPGQTYNYQSQFSSTLSSYGSYTVNILAEVDCYDEVDEVNENNNTWQETFPINVTPELLPDLVIEKLSSSVVELYPGEQLNFDIRLCNYGYVTAGQSVLSYRTYVDGYTPFSPKYKTCWPIDRGSCISSRYSIDLMTSSPGDHLVRIEAHADYNNNIEESNENNNTAELIIPIIIKGLQMEYPNGGEELVVDSNSIVKWQTHGTIPIVNLDISIDNGATWEVLDSGIANTGQYEWVVTEYWSSPTCLLRVSDASNASLYDESDDVFQTFVCTLKYDLDGDCFIDLNDIALLVSEWLQSGNPYN